MAKEKNIFLFNIIAMIVILISSIVYLIFKTPYVFKTLTSVLFVVAGVVNFIFARSSNFENKKNKRYAILMLTGLVFAMAGDIALIDFFEIGAGLFAIGHIFFFIAYLQMSQFCIRDLICFIILFLFTLLVILLYPGFVFTDFMRIVVIIYALIISLMLGKSISNLFDKKMGKVAKWIIFVGSLMFFLSDVCLLFNVFAGWGKWIDVMCLLFYYPAEIILGASIYYVTKKEK